MTEFRIQVYVGRIVEILKLKRRYPPCKQADLCKDASNTGVLIVSNNRNTISSNILGPIS